MDTCMVCEKNLADYLCLCSSPFLYVCNVCVGQHVIKPSRGSHSLEPIACRQFLRGLSDVPKYRARQLSVRFADEALDCNLQRLGRCKQGLEGVRNTVDHWFAGKFATLEEVEMQLKADVATCMDKTREIMMKLEVAIDSKLAYMVLGAETKDEDTVTRELTIFQCRIAEEMEINNLLEDLFQYQVLASPLLLPATAATPDPLIGLAQKQEMKRKADERTMEMMHAQVHSLEILIADNEEKLSEQKGLIQVLEIEVSKGREESLRLAAGRAEIQTEIESLRKEKNETLVKLQQVTGECAASQREIQLLKQKLATSQQEVQEAKQKLATSLQDAQKLQQHSETLRQEMQKKEHESAQDIQRLRQELATSQLDNQRIKQEFETSRQEIKRLEQALAKSQQETQKTKQELTTSQQTAQSANQQLVASRQEAQVSMQRLAASQQETLQTRNRLTAAQQGTEQQLAASQQKLQQTNQQLINIQQELQATKQQLIGVQQQLSQSAAPAFPPSSSPASLQEVHRHVRCDGCGASPITGPRWKCQTCPTFDFCRGCYDSKPHANDHKFKRIAPSVTQAAYDHEVHLFVKCDGCGQWPILGLRWKCRSCREFDLCQRCFGRILHPNQHQMRRMSPSSTRISYDFDN